MELELERDFTFHQKDTIVVGCSGGPDSMALLHALLERRELYQLKIIVAHVDHNVRKESKEECKYVEDFCNKNNIIFESMLISEYGDDNFENEARNIRYHFFRTIMDKYQADYLMTAHHGDDLMETILMRMVRGSSLLGYGGFQDNSIMDGKKIIRPLLRYTKEELEQYDKKHHINYFVDSSNENLNYTRNRYRKEVLPFLKKEDSRVHLKFLKFSKKIKETNDFIQKILQSHLKKVLNNNILSIEEFKKIDCFLQKEILYSLMANFYQDDLVLICDKHIDLLMNLIYSRRVNAQIYLPNEVVAEKRYEFLELRKITDEVVSYEIELSSISMLPNGKKIEVVDEDEGNSNFICRLSSKEVKLPLVVRCRKVGDKMTLKGMDGHKKVKDIFIDKKISKRERDLWPVVVDSTGEILWLPGLKKTKFDKKKTENYDIILKYS